MPTKKPDYELVDRAYHRNGVSGAAFNVVMFRDHKYNDGRMMLGVQFLSAADHTAVFDVEKLADGDIQFGTSSWRGDNYADFIYKALNKD